MYIIDTYVYLFICCLPISAECPCYMYIYSYTHTYICLYIDTTTTVNEFINGILYHFVPHTRTFAEYAKIFVVPANLFTCLNAAIAIFLLQYDCTWYFLYFLASWQF